MSKIALNWAKRQVGVSPVSRFVLWCLADLADHRNVAWPTWKHIHKETGLSRSSIYRAIEELDEADLIEITPRFKASGLRAGSSYKLAVDNSHSGGVRMGRPDPSMGIHKRGSSYMDPSLEVSDRDPRAERLSDGRMAPEHQEQGRRAIAEIRRKRGL